MGVLAGCSEAERIAPDAGPSDVLACGDTGHGTAAELARTPMADVDIERAVFFDAPGLTVDPVDYERAVSEMARIRAQYPDLRYVPTQDLIDGSAELSDAGAARAVGQTRLTLQLDAPTLAAVLEGTYDAWDCLNAHYGFDEPYAHRLGSAATTQRDGFVDSAQLAEDYATLPGVTRVTVGDVGAGLYFPPICIGREGDTWHYVFHSGSGDCLSGCIDHEFFHFIAPLGGEIEADGEFFGYPHASDRPAWVDYCAEN